MLATIVKGDAMNKDDVKKAFDQIEDLDVVISTIGGTPANPTADSEVLLSSPLLLLSSRLLSSSSPLLS